LTISPPSVVLGVQEPRLHNVPPQVESSGDFAIELAATAGLFLDPWQQLVLRDALGERPDGKWSAFEVCLIVPRQCGKGSVLEALELAMLIGADPGAPPPLILHSAHEFKTSAEHFRRMRDLFEGTDALRKKVRIIRTAAGSESIELHSGARLRFVTRTGGSGRGFSADTIVIDEAYNLTAEAMAAVLPTMSARPNPQVWYTSSAGLPASSQLARLRERGIKGSDRLAFFEWSATEDADLDDPRVWAQANPALGIRIPVEFVSAEREAMPDEQFARERLGIWQTLGGSAVVDPMHWNSLAVGNRQPQAPVLSVEVALDRSRATIGSAWMVNGKPHLEIFEERAGVDWVVPRLAELVPKYTVPTVVVDGNTEAASLVPALEAAHVKVLSVKGGERAAACAGLYDLVEISGLTHSRDPALSMALASARWKHVGEGTRVFSRRRSAGDIAALYAVTLALHGLTKDRPSVYEDRGLMSL
jgi:hypothetical protein